MIGIDKDMASKIQVTLNDSLEKRFNNYILNQANGDPDNKGSSSGTAASLIDFALRIKEHKRDDERSQRELLLRILECVDKSELIANHIYLNTYSLRNSLSEKDIDDSKTMLKGLIAKSKASVMEFLSMAASNDD